MVGHALCSVLMVGHAQVSSYVLEKLVFDRPIQFSNIDDQVCNLFSTGPNALAGLMDWVAAARCA